MALISHFFLWIKVRILSREFILYSQHKEICIQKSMVTDPIAVLIFCNVIYEVFLYDLIQMWYDIEGSSL